MKGFADLAPHGVSGRKVDRVTHLVDHNLWAAGGILGASEPPEPQDADEDEIGTDESAS